MISADFEKSIIALACAQRAKGGTHKSMLAVAMVLRNRVAAGWYKSDLYLNACAELNAVEFDRPEDAPRGFMDLDTRDPNFEKFLASLDDVIEGKIPDRTDGALWFVPRDPVPEKLSGEITASIDNLLFIR